MVGVYVSREGRQTTKTLSLISSRGYYCGQTATALAQKLRHTVRVRAFPHLIFDTGAEISVQTHPAGDSGMGSANSQASTTSVCKKSGLLTKCTQNGKDVHSARSKQSRKTGLSLVGTVSCGAGATTLRKQRRHRWSLKR
jgi:hypothetical protein